MRAAPPSLLSLPLLAVVCLAIACGSSERASADEAAVRQTFAAWKAAIGTGDGESALALASASTLELYERARALAVAGDDPTSEAAPMFERYLARMMADRYGRAALAGMDAATVFARVTADRPANDALARVTLEDLSVDDDRARGTLALDGKEVDMKLTFVREGGRWKVDVSGVAARGGETLRAIPKQLDRDPEAWLDEALDADR